jgi:hypothetical protein
VIRFGNPARATGLACYSMLSSMNAGRPYVFFFAVRPAKVGGAVFGVPYLGFDNRQLLVRLPREFWLKGFPNEPAKYAKAYTGNARLAAWIHDMRITPTWMLL